MIAENAATAVRSYNFQLGAMSIMKFACNGPPKLCLFPWFCTLTDCLLSISLGNLPIAIIIKCKKGLSLNIKEMDTTEKLERNILESWTRWVCLHESVMVIRLKHSLNGELHLITWSLLLWLLNCEAFVTIARKTIISKCDITIEKKMLYLVSNFRYMGETMLDLHVRQRL